MESSGDYIPYCGSPPIPGALEWNLDPVLLACLGALLACHAWGDRKAPAGAAGPQRRMAFVAGWAVATLALVSPLCHLSVALFGARIGQHILLLLVAAPLVAFGRPGLILHPFLPDAWRRRQAGPARGALAVPVFAVLLWAWHLPGPYDATLAGDATYWAMHVSLFAAAVWLWRALLDADHPHSALLAGAGTAVQMGLLGALLTLAPTPLFEAHQATTWPWGLTPLEDQQLGGLLMWVPGGLLFTVASLTGVYLWLRPDLHREAARSE
jgi:putative membrane protein